MRTSKGMKVLAVLLLLVSTSCGDDDDDAATGGEDTTVDDTTDNTDDGDGESSEVTVQIDGDADEFNAAFLAYFPDAVTVHPGDTIVYESNFSGEPHSITFGTLVDDIVEGFQALTPEQLEGEPPPELAEAFERIPPMLPEGPGDANQASVNPCFIASGELPDDPSQQCDETEPEPFTGTELFYNSGFLPDGETFELELADDIAPGTYVGFCTLHFTEMTSEVTVVPADEEIPSADEVAQEADSQLQEMVSPLQSAFEQAQESVSDGRVQTGAAPEDEEVPGLVTEFVPGDIEVAAGDQVTWSFVGPHTVSFNAPEEARVLLAKGEDGGFHLTEQAVAPQGFEPPGGPPGGGEEGEGPPEGEEGPPPPIDAGTWDGTGFFSSGIAFGGDFLLGFSEPGSYEYVCLIHPDMEGTVTVT